MSLPKYPEYKDSQVAWLGSVPTHWKVDQTKRHFLRRKEVNVGMACSNRLALTMNGVIPRSLDDLDGLQSSDFEGYQIFDAGDLAFKLIDLQNIKTSRVGLVGERGIMSPAYIRLKPQGTANTRFSYWYFMALYWTQVFNSLGGGVRQTLAPEELLTVPFPVPSLLEQEAIAAFLDRETTKIDALIAEQEKLITLLAEKRQATISHAVTRGLNPDAPMKDTGVEWLGQVPAHWEVWKVRHAFGGIGSGTTPPSDEARWYEEGTIPWVTTGELRESEVLTTSKMVTSEAIERFTSLRIHPKGSLAIAMYGATIGRLGILGVEAATNQACCVLSGPRSLEVKFVFYWLLGFKQEIIERYATGGGQPNINQEVISGLRIPAPRPNEQAAIAEFLDAEIGRLAQLEVEAAHAISLLTERRAALIAAAVTGQIDVRSTLPEAA